MFRKDKAFLKNPIFPHYIIPIIVSVLLVAVFCLPDNLKEQYALRGGLGVCAFALHHAYKNGCPENPEL
jgi:hypothetical protein